MLNYIMTFLSFTFHSFPVKGSGEKVVVVVSDNKRLSLDREYTQVTYRQMRAYKGKMGIFVLE